DFAGEDGLDAGGSEALAGGDDAGVVDLARGGLRGSLKECGDEENGRHIGRAWRPACTGGTAAKRISTYQRRAATPRPASGNASPLTNTLPVGPVSARAAHEQPARCPDSRGLCVPGNWARRAVALCSREAIPRPRSPLALGRDHRVTRIGCAHSMSFASVAFS